MTLPGSSETDAATARVLFKGLTSRAARRKLSLTVQDREVSIPPALVPALIEAAKLISEGHTVDVVPADEEISAQEAADILKYRAAIS